MQIRRFFAPEASSVARRLFRTHNACRAAMASEASASRAYVLYGVAGCGKTTLGRALVERLNDAAPETKRDAVFVDADDLHSPEAREKMSQGEPLTETDREPWLARVRARMLESARPSEITGKTTPRDVLVGGLGPGCGPGRGPGR